MNPMIVMKATGARTMPLGMTVAEPASEMTSTELMSFAEGMGNGPLLANTLSTCSAHERCGVHLYRTAAGMTQVPAWAARYEEFLTHTEQQVRVLAELTTQLGGDPMYVSPEARITEYIDSKLMEPILLGGSIDAEARDMVMLEAVMLAETKRQANWELLGLVAELMPASSAQQAMQAAVAQVEEQVDEHVRWARQTWQQTMLAYLVPATRAD